MTHFKKPVLAYDYPEQEWGPPCPLKDGDTFVCFKCKGTSTVNWENGLYFDFNRDGVGYYTHEHCVDRSTIYERPTRVPIAEPQYEDSKTDNLDRVLLVPTKPQIMQQTLFVF